MWARIREVESDFGRSPTGSAYAEMFRRHMREATRLVNKNRRVGVAWQRNGGPLIVQAVLRALRDPTYPLPSQIMDKQLDECLDGIANAFRNHASEDFITDLELFLRISSPDPVVT